MKKLLLLFLFISSITSAQVSIDQPSDMYICSNDGFATVNLTILNNDVLDNLNPDLYTVNYYTSLQDAINNINHITQPELFITTSPWEQIIYVRVIDNSNPNIINITNFNIVISAITIVPLQDIELCSGILNTNSSYFTLDTGLPPQSHFFIWQCNGVTIPGATQSSYTPSLPGEYTVIITNTSGCTASDSATVTLSSLADSPISVTSYGQTVTVNVQGDAGYMYQMDFGEYQSSNVFTNVPYGTRHISVQDGCGNIVILSVYVDTLTPLEIGTPESLSICVPYGSTDLPAFDLTVNDSIVLNGLNPDEYTVEYYNGNSFNNNDLITNPENYNSLIGSGQALRVKVTKNSNPDLFGVSLFTLNLGPTPLITIVEPLIIEDSNNAGTGIIDLTGNYDDILNGQPADITTIQYFTSEADAIAAINPISNPQAFETGSRTIYYILSMFSCSNTGSFNVILDSDLNANKNTFTSLQYYPNPVNDYITFSNNITIESIEMYNQLGQKVISNTHNSSTVKTDMSGLANGLYIIKIKSGNTEKIIKVIKQ